VQSGDGNQRWGATYSVIWLEFISLSKTSTAMTGLFSTNSCNTQVLLFQHCDSHLLCTVQRVRTTSIWVWRLILSYHSHTIPDWPTPMDKYLQVQERNHLYKVPNMMVWKTKHAGNHWGVSPQWYTNLGSVSSSINTCWYQHHALWSMHPSKDCYAQHCCSQSRCNPHKVCTHFIPCVHLASCTHEGLNCARC
jgi:hypothetical protein